jgi:CO/xanthine dehydrogenase Mo-binding subunit
MPDTSTLKNIYRGNSRFLQDMVTEPCFYGSVFRSSRAKAKIQEIRIPAHESDITVLQAKDIPGDNFIQVHDSQVPILTASQVNYIGEPILLACGPKKHIVDQLIGEISIAYEDDIPTLQYKNPVEEDILFNEVVVRGTPDQAFKEAFQVLEGMYETGIQEHFYNEPHSALANFQNDTISIVTPTQWPYHVQRAISSVLNIPKKNVVIKPSKTGTCYNGYLWSPSLVSTYAALLSQETGVPVFLRFDRSEDFCFTPKRVPVYITQKTGINAEGNITVLDIEIRYSSGFYPIFADEMVKRLIISSQGVYSCPNIRVSVQNIRTNLPPLGPFTGSGTAETNFAIETHITKISEIAQTPPHQFRSANISKNIEANSVMAEVVEISDFSRKYASFELLKKRRKEKDAPLKILRGTGLSVGFQGSGFAGDREKKEAAAVEMILESDNHLTVLSSAVPETPSTVACWKKKISKNLNIPLEDIHFSENDTSKVPNSGPSIFSRNLTVIPKIIDTCSNAILKKRFRDPLPLSLNRTFKNQKAQEQLESPEEPSYQIVSWGACVVEVSVHPVSFETIIKGIWMCINGGQILNPHQAERTVEQSIYAALGWAAWENLHFVNGRIPKDLIDKFSISPPNSLPRPVIKFIESEIKNTPAGIEELPFNCIPSAYISAVSQATGIVIDKIPCNPPLIHSYGQKQ